MADEHEGASIAARLIGACRDNNVDMLEEIINDLGGEDNPKVQELINNTKNPLGEHLYHLAARKANYHIIDRLLDVPNFECDPVNRMEGDTPLHSAIRWINENPTAAAENLELENGDKTSTGAYLVKLMLEAGSNPRVKNRAKLTAMQLVDPRNKEIRQLIQETEYTNMMSGDFVSADEVKGGSKPFADVKQQQKEEESDDDVEFSGSDEEERTEWERRRKARKGR